MDFCQKIDEQKSNTSNNADAYSSELKYQFKHQGTHLMYNIRISSMRGVLKAGKGKLGR